jgi:hypothetical protein
MRLLSFEFAGTDGVVRLSPFLYRVSSSLDGFHPGRLHLHRYAAASGWIKSCAIFCSLLFS